MSKIKSLNPFLKPLEYFFLQYFSFSDLKFNIDLKFICKVLFGVFYIILTLIFTFMYRVEWFNMLCNFSIDDNFFGYNFEIFILYYSVIHISWLIFEVFIKFKSNIKFVKLLIKFECILMLNFNKKFALKSFKKILMHRLVLIGFYVASVFFAVKDNIDKYGLNGIVVSLVHINFILLTSFIMYKICFYLDIICICLMNLNEILDKILKFSHNRNLFLRQIYQFKKCYILILKMTQELNYFMSNSISLFMLTGIFWMTVRLYRIPKLNNDIKFVGKYIKHLGQVSREDYGSAI